MSEQTIAARRGLSRAVPQSRWFPIGLGIGLFLLLFLVYGAVQRFLVLGHEALGTTKEVPWGVFICNYAWAISSIGLSYIASFGIVLGIREFDVIGRRALYLALLIVIAGAMNVGSDLEQPLRAWHMLLTPHLTAPMGMVAPTLTLYIMLISIELYLLIKRGHHDILVKTVAVVAFMAAVLVHSYHGAIFGLTHSREFWYGPYYPIYFLLSALFASSAMIIFVTVATYKATGKQMSHRLRNSLSLVGEMLAYLLCIALFFDYWKMNAAIFGHQKEGMIILKDPVFWVFEVGMTYLIPLALLLWSRFRDYNKMAVAGALCVFGLWFARWDFIISGQLVPYLGFTPFTLGGSLSHLASYTPSLTEIAFTIGSLGFIWTFYVLGVRYLPLDKDELEGVVEPESEPLISVYIEPDEHGEKRERGITGIKS